MPPWAAAATLQPCSPECWPHTSCRLPCWQALPVVASPWSLPVAAPLAANGTALGAPHLTSATPACQSLAGATTTRRQPGPHTPPCYPYPLSDSPLCCLLAPSTTFLCAASLIAATAKALVSSLPSTSQPPPAPQIYTCLD